MRAETASHWQNMQMSRSRVLVFEHILPLFSVVNTADADLFFNLFCPAARPRSLCQRSRGHRPSRVLCSSKTFQPTSSFIFWTVWNWMTSCTFSWFVIAFDLTFHRPDIPDRAEILDLLQAAKIVRQPIALDSDSAANPIR
jgi:hypothetical protein